jgi:hypothetical protein
MVHGQLKTGCLDIIKNSGTTNLAISTPDEGAHECDVLLGCMSICLEHWSRHLRCRFSFPRETALVYG